MSSDPEIEIQLLPEEQTLLLQYGYPFEPQQEQLQKMVRREMIGTMTISSYYLERMLGDLCYSIKNTKGQTQQQLIELCDRLEYVERTHDGMLDIL